MRISAGPSEGARRSQARNKVVAASRVAAGARHDMAALSETQC